MGRPKKRTRILAPKTAPTNITITPFVDSKGYSSHRVQGWKEDGKWMRKQFKKRADAERFVALKRVELENKGRAQQMVLSPLNQQQLDSAVRAYDLLGDTYSLDEAVEYFLENHRPPDFQINLKDGIKLYRDERERDGVRDRTIKQTNSVLSMFTVEADNCMVHKVTPQKIESFLRGLRAKDGKSPAKRKTWNNYRNDLNHFFRWCSTKDKATNRPWTFTNPVESVRYFKAKQIAEQRDDVVTTEVEDVVRMFSTLMRWRDGVLVKPYALAFFAGIRPDGELRKLAPLAKKLINLRTRRISIPAHVSKTSTARMVNISENLAVWLKAYSDKPIIPTNWDRLNKRFRAHFGLTHDETRHSFVSYYVAKHRSVGDAALQAGNSESVVHEHYLDLRTMEEGTEFFGITPDTARRRAVINEAVIENGKVLKVG